MYKILIEAYDNTLSSFQNLVNNHYHNIFPNNANRNAAGFAFFKYILDHLANNEESFDLYNSFYCAVSGSIVQPHPYNFNIIKVKDQQGQCVIGKYYRCCTPCICDIMKYTEVCDVDIEIPKNSKQFYTKRLLVIGDPCIDPAKLPPEVDKNIFQCNNQLLLNGYRVDSQNKLTDGPGKLVIGVLYPISESQNTTNQIEHSLSICQERLNTEPENLKYGMGDIFVKLSMINNINTQDLCK